MPAYLRDAVTNGGQLSLAPHGGKAYFSLAENARSVGDRTLYGALTVKTNGKPGPDRTNFDYAINCAIAALSAGEDSLMAMVRHGDPTSGHTHACRARANMCREAKALLEKAIVEATGRLPTHQQGSTDGS